MTVNLTLALVAGGLAACGVYLLLERSLTRVLIGFLLLGNATNLLLLIVMGFPGVSPFYGEERRQSDPLPEALMLTAIVITFAVSAFLLALIYRSWQLGQADTVEDDAEDIALRERAADTEDVLDDEALYLCFELHTELVQFDDGTQRSAEPAGKLHRELRLRQEYQVNLLSKSMRNFCAGVPMEMYPAHSRSFCSSVVGSFCRLSW